MEYARTAIKKIVINATSSTRRQHRRRQSEVLRVSDLEVLGTAFDQFGALAHKLQRASLIRHRITGRLQGGLQGSKAEHLRRLGQPFVAAVHGSRYTAAVLLLQGVGQFQGQQATHSVVLAGIYEPVHVSGGDQAARGVVHQHPVVQLRTLGHQGRNTVKNAAGARSASASSYKNRSAHELGG